MAVPASGTLTMLGIAQERMYGTYGTGTITGPIVTTDLINGGNTGGSGNSYPALNTSSPSKPNTTAPHAMSEWYSYDQDYEQWRSFTMHSATSYDDGGTACGQAETDDTTLYFDDGSSGTGSACPTVGDVLYDSSAMTTVFDGQDLWWYSGNCTYSYMISSGGNIDDELSCI